jgi:hypothetical protein
MVFAGVLELLLLFLDALFNLRPKNVNTVDSRYKAPLDIRAGNFGPDYYKYLILTLDIVVLPV